MRGQLTGYKYLDQVCLECGTEAAWARGLCQRCYGVVRRAQSLDLYPTNQYIDHPEQYVGWAVKYNLDDLQNALLQHGYHIVRTDTGEII